MHRWLIGIWYEGAGGGAWLRPLAALFGAAVRLRRAAYRRGWLRVLRVGRPVIVVGNLSVGGTGKTPLVIELARLLAERGVKPGIVSRGYGGRARAPLLVDDACGPEVAGDEAWLMRRRTGCAVAVGRDRVAAARLLVDAGASVIVSDDGLQHHALARDAEIVVIDATRGLGNGRLLPAGPLRELPARLEEVDAVVLNGGPRPEWPRAIPMRLVPGEAVALGGEGPARRLATLAGQRVHAVAGIGNPARFFAMLRDHGLVVEEHPFPDHHVFAARELEFGDAYPVLMTEKDAVKCVSFRNPRLWYVPVRGELAAEDAQRLLGCLLSRIGPEGSWTRA
ncbi:MAG: tetraacyldisaccharide 4'-kinase [Gammaproteobacteria bacterium]|nr:tetraacyldisaccharide 4'-kinase [Gammaproteobacteria bacterium]